MVRLIIVRKGGGGGVLVAMLIVKCLPTKIPPKNRLLSDANDKIFPVFD
jgi:hypothetical protein